MTEIIIALIAAVFASQGFWAWLQTRNRRKSSETQLLMGIGYSRILSECQKHLTTGSIEPKELKELTDYLYKPYKDMGGDGTVDALMAQVRALRIEIDKK